VKESLMKALIVYESMFGNTETVARAIAEGLAETAEVQLTEVSRKPSAPGPEVDLLIAGGPTHAFSMTRTNTRADAISRGAVRGDPEFGLREWLEALPESEHPHEIATFDTKVDTMRHLPGSAAKGAARIAHRHGYEPAVRAESFFVKDVDGPLLPGEVERAREWGRHLAEWIGATAVARQQP
jgi:hypothetical protein